MFHHDKVSTFGNGFNDVAYSDFNLGPKPDEKTKTILPVIIWLAHRNNNNYRAGIQNIFIGLLG